MAEKENAFEIAATPSSVEYTTDCLEKLQELKRVYFKPHRDWSQADSMIILADIIDILIEKEKEMVAKLNSTMRHG